MIRPVLLATATVALVTTTAPAQAPQFDTPARSAYLIDLSSGAELLSKNADQRMPPASMAKMMTTEVAFELIDRGQLPLTKTCTVRPETWKAWHGPQAGSTMFLSVNEQVSVENLLHGIVTLSGNDASVVLAECIAGTEQAFAGQMNALAHQLGLNNSHFGNSNGWPDEGRTYVTARDLATLARASIERHPKLYKQFYGQPSFTWGKTLGSGQDITQANRNPILGKVLGADGLKTGHTDEAGYGFTVAPDLAHADIAIVRTSAPFQTLHPGYAFGARFHEGDLGFRGGDKEFEEIKRITAAVPTIVTVYLDRPAILTELKDRANALVGNFGVSDAALLDVLTGVAQPEGKLPFELPSSMQEVEAQKSAVPHDTAHPLYRIGFGRMYSRKR
jgi:hypothetical protein